MQVRFYVYCIFFYDYYMVGFWFSIFILSFLTILYIIAPLSIFFLPYPDASYQFTIWLCSVGMNHPHPTGGKEVVFLNLLNIWNLVCFFSISFLVDLILFFCHSWHYFWAYHIVWSYGWFRFFEPSQLNCGRWRTQPELYIHIPEDDVIRHCS